MRNTVNAVSLGSFKSLFCNNGIVCAPFFAKDIDSQCEGDKAKHQLAFLYLFLPTCVNDDSSPVM